MFEQLLEIQILIYEYIFSKKYSIINIVMLHVDSADKISIQSKMYDAEKWN